MYLKSHFCIRRYLNFFPANLGDEINKQGEIIHQQVKVIEEQSKGFCNEGRWAKYINK